MKSLRFLGADRLFEVAVRVSVVLGLLAAGTGFYLGRCVSNHAT